MRILVPNLIGRKYALEWYSFINDNLFTYVIQIKYHTALLSFGYNFDTL